MGLCSFFEKLLKKHRSKKVVKLSDQETKPLQRQDIDQLLEHVEQHGLHTEGIYRKPGGALKMRELRQQLKNDPKVVHLEDYSIHTITSLVKEWLREQPEPITFAHYSAFLHAMELREESAQLRQIYGVLDMLPPANIDLLGRIIFHLVRVASEEAFNKMSTHSLAIVFAPSILRSAGTTDPRDTMHNMSNITMCLELILNEEKRRYEELQEGEPAEALASWSSMKRGRLLRSEGRYDLHAIV